MDKYKRPENSSEKNIPSEAEEVTTDLLDIIRKDETADRLMTRGADVCQWLDDNLSSKVQLCNSPKEKVKSEKRLNEFLSEIGRSASSEREVVEWLINIIDRRRQIKEFLEKIMSCNEEEKVKLWTMAVMSRESLMNIWLEEMISNSGVTNTQLQGILRSEEMKYDWLMQTIHQEYRVCNWLMTKISKEKEKSEWLKITIDDIKQIFYSIKSSIDLTVETKEFHKLFMIWAKQTASSYLTATERKIKFFIQTTKMLHKEKNPPVYYLEDFLQNLISSHDVGKDELKFEEVFIPWTVEEKLRTKGDQKASKFIAPGQLTKEKRDISFAHSGEVPETDEDVETAEDYKTEEDPMYPSKPILEIFLDEEAIVEPLSQAKYKYTMSNPLHDTNVKSLLQVIANTKPKSREIKEGSFIPRLLSSTDASLTPSLIRDSDCDEVYPGIFVGSGSAAKNMKLLQALAITHVLNAAHGYGFHQVQTGERFYKSYNIAYLGLCVHDQIWCYIKLYFKESCAFIDEALNRSGKVLISCWQGNSRSGIFAMAYLVLAKMMTVEQALATVRQQRDIHPNFGFLKQLIDAQSNDFLNVKTFFYDDVNLHRNHDHQQDSKILLHGKQNSPKNIQAKSRNAHLTENVYNIQESKVPYLNR